MNKQRRLVFLDFETYFDDEYSLSKMPTPNYILDPRFEVICVAVKDGSGEARVIDGPDFPAYLATLDPAVTATVTHNALFDNCILAWRYNFVPSLMLDTLGMARALLGHKSKRFSLQAVSELMGVGTKGSALHSVKGMHRAEIMASPGLYIQFWDYAKNDVELCAAIYDKLILDFPECEQKVMDLVLRCAVEPKLMVDKLMLVEHLEELQQHKANLLASVNCSLADLMSAPKFAKVLRGLGVDVPMKVSRATGKALPALAKTDPFMAELAESADPVLAALAAARLGHKSTIEETRGRKFLSVAIQPWPDRYRGGNGMSPMPVPLRYAGAHTGRLSGDWGLNLQNLPTARGSSGKSKLRHSLIAPPGYTILVADLAQIEARVTAWFCNETHLLDQFRRKLDPYAIMGRKIFAIPSNQIISSVERFIGKTAILGLGYGCGVAKFDSMVRQQARAGGIDLTGRWALATAQKAVDTYRLSYRSIRSAWGMLGIHVAGEFCLSGVWSHHPIVMSYGRVALPNGMALLYGDPHETVDGVMYHYNGIEHKIYGAKMLENIVQALARIILMNAALRLNDRGYRFVLQAHDELVFLVPDGSVDKAKKVIYEEMVRPPSWAEALPLEASVTTGKSYGEAK